MKALVFDHFGDADVLRYEERPDPVPAPGEVLVRTRAIGLNFADIYRRKGDYHLAGEPPWIAGYEAAGEVVSAPSGLGLTPGDRVAFTDSPFAHAELVAVPFERIIPLPADIAWETAAAVLLQGLTAQYLVRDSYPLKAGDVALVHAAAGGVGRLLLQLIVRLGARAIGMTTREWKRAEILAAGAEQAWLVSDPWVERAQALGVDVVYDSVGATVLQSLAAVRPGGSVVFFGMAGGAPPRVDPRVLMDGSRTLTGGDLWNVLDSREERLRRSSELFGWVRDGSLDVRIAARIPLAQGAEAHRQLESGRHAGKVLLIP